MPFSPNKFYLNPPAVSDARFPKFAVKLESPKIQRLLPQSARRTSRIHTRHFFKDPPHVELILGPSWAAVIWQRRDLSRFVKRKSSHYRRHRRSFFFFLPWRSFPVRLRLLSFSFPHNESFETSRAFFSLSLSLCSSVLFRRRCRTKKICGVD